MKPTTCGSVGVVAWRRGGVAAWWRGVAWWWRGVVAWWRGGVAAWWHPPPPAAAPPTATTLLRGDRVKGGHARGDGGGQVEAEQAGRQQPLHHERQRRVAPAGELRGVQPAEGEGEGEGESEG